MAKIRGVNLGNWLVLEKWMKPKLFEGLKAEDETAFSSELGDRTLDRLKPHRDSYISYNDFKWISEAGLNAVRLPIPHWIFGDVRPYYGCIDYLDSAMEWAQRTGIKVLLDLHTAPGCQNGFDNGGICGVCEWHTREEYVTRTVEVIAKVAARYNNHPALWGIQLLNEPRWDVPMDILRDYYLRGYDACRRHVDENVAIILHDGFRLTEWKDFMRETKYKNVLLDTHFYQCFSDDDKMLDVPGHLQRASVVRADQIKEMSAYFPIVVGEWSLGIEPEYSLKGMNKVQLDSAFRAFAGAQLLAYETAEGWFFWSYKVQNSEAFAWDYKNCVDEGWFKKTLRE